MITFEEDQSYGYRERTIKNASADITLAFAIDFNSAGEKLTKSAVRDNRKKYFDIDVKKVNPRDSDWIAVAIHRQLFGYNVETINIAGNGIYTVDRWMNQNECDGYVYDFLQTMFASALWKYRKIKLIRSGGQTGFDEAGLKAAVRLGIPTLCLAPKGWKFRDINGVDISDEKQFKARFL